MTTQDGLRREAVLTVASQDEETNVLTHTQKKIQAVADFCITVR